MRDRRLDRLFLRYRTRGDARALGEVFDASAQELLRVAMNLVRDPGEADDLLQATFLTALEKAEAWDSRRRLVPWLIGILIHHAHDLRRRRGREVDPERLVAREVEQPIDEATRIEAGESLRQAIAGLPARYREVLEPFVERGRRAAEIAVELGRPPGTVRMQIHRGLDLLRKALPPGLALGALVVSAGPGRAAVREAVMREAARRAPQLAAGAAATGATLLGTLTMSKKALLATLTLAAVSTLAWFGAGVLAPDRGQARGVGAVLPDPGPSDLVDGAGGTIDGAPDTKAAGAAPGAASRAPGRVDPGTDYDANLAALVGRLIEQDRSPVPGVPVTLIELGMEALDRVPGDAFLPPAERGADWVVQRTVTGPDGTFRLRGARPHALQGVGFDLGGARPWMQVVDRYLEPAGETDLGDIVLPAGVPVVGRVVDATGQPIPGARVRAGGFDDEAFDWHRFAACDERTPLIVRQNQFLSVLVELPEHVAPILELVPFTTSSTDARGRFELPAAPAGALRLLIDHPDHQGLVVRAAPPVDGLRDLGDVTLSAGGVLIGRVVDDEGEPVPGAEVRGGGFFDITWQGPEIAPLGARAVADGKGDFRLTGLPEDDSQRVLVARADPEHPWVIHRPAASGKLVIGLPSRHDVQVRVQDAEGAPLEAQLVAYQPSLLGALEWGALLDPKKPRGTVERTGPGAYLVRDLQKANYVLHARAPGHAVATARLRPRARAREVVVTLEPERELVVRVLDEGSDAPVGRARVGLVADRKSTRLLSRADTDGAGLARLPGVPHEHDEGAYLRVAHPRYATRNLPLEWATEGEELLVRLGPGGGVVFQCRDDGRPPVAPVMFELDLPTDSPFANDYTKRFGLIGPEGDAAMRHLPPGTWRWRAFERYLHNDMWQLMTRTVRSPFIRSGEVTVVAGETVTVDLDLTGYAFTQPLPGGSSGLVGHVLVDGQVPTGFLMLRYVDRRSYDPQRLEFDAQGGFVAQGLAAGRYELELYIERSLEFVEWTMTDLELIRRVELREGGVARVDIELETASVPVRVVDGEGQGMGAVPVRLASTDPRRQFSAEGTTTSDGTLDLEVRHGGPARLEATDPDHGRARIEVDLLTGDGNGPYLLTLDPGVTVAGSLRVDTAALLELYPEALTFSYRLNLKRVDDPLEMLGRFVVLEEERATAFSLAGLSPGVWTAELTGGPWLVHFVPLEVSVGSTDTLDVALEFERDR